MLAKMELATQNKITTLETKTVLQATCSNTKR